MGNAENEPELLKKARTCSIDLLDLLDEIEKELENNKGDKTALEAKRIVNNRLAVKEAVTGIPQK